MINRTSVIQQAVTTDRYFPLATAALREAAREIGLSSIPSWPQPCTTLDNQLDAVQNIVHGLVKPASFKPLKELQALAVALGFTNKPNFHDWARVRDVLQLALLDLSSNAAILLPAHEDYSTSAFSAFEASRERPIFKQINDVFRDNPKLPQRGSRRIASLVAATDWLHLGDFSIDDLALLNQAVVRNAPDESTIGSALAVLPFLHAIEALLPEVLPRDLRHQYMMWQASSQFLHIPFADFRLDQKNFAGLRVHGHKRERVETPELIALRTQNRHIRDANSRVERSDPPFILRLREIAASGAADAPEQYYEALAGGRNTDFRKENWIQAPTLYPGREHVPIQQLGQLWFATMNTWIAHRETSFETDKEVRTALHMLIDYLLMYIPWWNELHPDSQVELPAAPRHFSRYLFVSRTVFHREQGQSDAIMPETLIKLLHLRRPTLDGKNKILGCWERFFQFVITAYEENELVAGKKMVNPIRLDFDRVKSSARAKTNKVPFAEDEYPLLVFYCQAIEAFGEYLLQAAYDQDIFKNLAFGEELGYDTEEWGFVPYIRYRGEILPLRWLPNIYVIARRSIQANPEGPGGIYVNGQRQNRGVNRVMVLNIPHLTVVRMLLVIIETGLRGQSVQWLDRLTWDSLSGAKAAISKLHTWAPPESFTLLLVNTDKSRDKPWTAYISWRVRRSLLAESYFQMGISGPAIDEPVLYERRKNSRFGPIVPLFRSSRESMPFSDSTYSARWSELLTGFENFYNNLRATTGDDQYRELKYLSERTPHSMRSTYATLKDGDLEVSEIAEQIGHLDTVTTNYYQVPSKARLVGKLEKIESRITNLAYDVAGSGAGYVDTESPDSTLRKAFATDREAAILAFGFTPGVALWSLSDLTSDEESSIELLRRSPPSVIRWHASHVCPVGNQCPSEIVVRIGGLQRCGLCPLAVKCIDHLPAIAAKKNELKERIRMSAMHIKSLATRKVGTRSQRDALHRAMNLDAKELMGWELSAQILHDTKQRMGAEHDGYHVDQPEMVKRHLELITRDASAAEFFLQRIADSNAYPSFESPEVRARAGKYVQIIMARAGRDDDAKLLDLEPFSELAAFASLIKPMADAKGLGLTAIAELLSGGNRNELGVVSGPSLLGGDR